MQDGIRLLAIISWIYSAYALFSHGDPGRVWPTCDAELSVILYLGTGWCHAQDVLALQMGRHLKWKAIHFWQMGAQFVAHEMAGLLG